MNRKLISFASILIFVSCTKDLTDEKTLEQTEKPTSFSKEEEAISFHSMDVFKNFMETYQENEDEITEFYKEGFVPYRPLDNLNEQTFSELVQAKKTIVEKENLSFSRLPINNEGSDEEYDEEDDNFIRNDKFASILNAKGEIIIADTIYRYTPYGRFSSHISKKEKLEAYINQLTPDYKAVEGTFFVTEDIQRFIPLRKEFEKYQIVDMKNIENSLENDKKSKNDGAKTARFDIPEDTSHYNSCHNSRSSWVDRLFGVSYDCEYYFTSKRKLRTTFAVENYGVYMEVYAQAKFKQKTWFGWFSSRDAQYTYLKINHAALTFSEKEVSIKSNDLGKDLGNIKAYGKQIAEWIKPIRNTQAVVNTIITPQSSRTFLSGINDFGSFIRNGVNMAKEVINDAELNIDLNGFFDEKTHNVVVLSIVDRDFSVTNKQIIESAFEELKRKGEILIDKPTGLFLMEHDGNSGKVTSRSYTIYDEIHYSTGLAVVGKDFKIPKELTLKNITFGYVNNNLSNGKYSIQSSASFIYPKVKNIDLSIETGAFYGGRWGGSKLTVIYND
jgi:lipoprotein